MDLPDISVIIACLNGAETLPETLASLAAQAWDRPWEILLADNGSTDASVEVFARFARAHPGLRMRVVDAGGQKGKSYALNLAIRAAAGRAILFCDADDTVAPRLARRHGRERSTAIPSWRRASISGSSARTGRSPRAGSPSRNHLHRLPLSAACALRRRRHARVPPRGLRGGGRLRPRLPGDGGRRLLRAGAPRGLPARLRAGGGLPLPLPRRPRGDPAAGLQLQLLPRAPAPALRRRAAPDLPPLGAARRARAAGWRGGGRARAPAAAAEPRHAGRRWRATAGQLWGQVRGALAFRVAPPPRPAGRQATRTAAGAPATWRSRPPA